ncbi:hypothetical protein BS50DRAFT_203919 [Corynespora cassiicola Philippines]|uniref:Uncharacterized protein n=1 Tax=Corynespora cassiicola Philippines TaxID=1448308 RepID=A0A2T2N566_CORCC|nr:hypothetical protein BS50DRAFT_203919 [Corynespora cassiicola Philippines]
MPPCANQLVAVRLHCDMAAMPCDEALNRPNLVPSARRATHLVSNVMPPQWLLPRPQQSPSSQSVHACILPLQALPMAAACPPPASPATQPRRGRLNHGHWPHRHVGLLRGHCTGEQISSRSQIMPLRISLPSHGESRIQVASALSGTVSP